MKKPLLAPAVLSALGSYGTAQAQTSVNIFGLIDATISTINNENAQGQRLTGFQTPWFSGSRLGFKGAEDLGGGLKAISKLESEYVIQTGEFDDPSQLFGRDAWVGIVLPRWYRWRIHRLCQYRQRRSRRFFERNRPLRMVRSMFAT